MKKKILIEGMVCEKCSNRVQDALEDIDSTVYSMVNIEEKIAVVKFTGKVESSTIVDIIDKLGYSVLSIEDI